MAIKSHFTVGEFFLAGGTALEPRLRSLRRDFVYAVSMVSIAGLATCVYLLGQRGVWRFGWQELLVAIAGGRLAEWSKYGLTGKHLAPREAAQDVSSRACWRPRAVRCWCSNRPPPGPISSP